MRGSPHAPDPSGRLVGLNERNQAMALLKKLFGKSEKAVGDESPDVDGLIDSEDLNASIITLDDHISKICDYGDSVERLNAHQKVFFWIQSLEREINNGGFNQYYFNNSGDFAHETVESLKAIGAEKTALILQKANHQFPGNRVPKDRDERQDVLEQIENDANKIWDELDKEFCAYEEDLNALNMKYVKAHRSDFM